MMIYGHVDALLTTNRQHIHNTFIYRVCLHNKIMLLDCEANEEAIVFYNGGYFYFFL